MDQYLPMAKPARARLSLFRGPAKSSMEKRLYLVVDKNGAVEPLALGKWRKTSEESCRDLLSTFLNVLTTIALRPKKKPTSLSS